MCPLCHHDGLLLDAVINKAKTRKQSWLSCVHCGWKSEVLESDATESVWEKILENSKIYSDR